MSVSAAEFHSVASRDDWQLVFEGALAHYVCPDALARVEFARRVLVLASEAAAPDLDLRRGGVTVRLPASFEVGGLTVADAELAGRISQVAAELGLGADLSHLQSVQIAVDGGTGAVPFWQAVMGYDRVADADLLDPLRRGPEVWNQAVNDGRSAPASPSHRRVCVACGGRAAH
ncbi:MAG: hypothetical protein WKF76_11995 [Nocardioidaceae bacterium]